ncbi:hypothetical protein BMF94_4677 [Rhodotorula taiwanensis]|uniref:Micro-fibrillar-associated protein 1 C-terminal domain-containing protein n=1 Tax=Rhodotorula taiwanensis TaxID=741276 RepID=A0A2S5B6G2_9BASI|nr:hypothetical protein BMF94_4677 [Rhodotorula taiwanensis]
MPPKLTQPLRPAARYRPGKAPVPAADDSDYSDNDQEEQDDAASAQAQADEGNDDDDDEQVTEFTTANRAAKGRGAAINVALKQVEVDQTGKVKVGGRDEVGRTEMESSEGEYETDSEDEKPAPKPVFRPKAAPAQQASRESSEYETDSEEESEEEEPLKPIYKPVFVSKRNRDTIAERQKELDPELLEAKREEEERKRREEAKALVADSIIREIATKEAQEVHPDVDDTDGLDPEAEFEAWKLRELMRLKRDREARYALEKVREEVEARRAMPEELRLKEDTDRAEKTRKEKKRGQQAFLQKYHHKGVFHQDLDILKKHDYTAPTESTIADVSSLPAVMQKRNFGKAHQTKYTHLAAEDTSRQSGGWGRPGGSGPGGSGAAGSGCFICGGPHLKRDCPQLGADGTGAGGPTASGANAGARDGGDSGWSARRPPPPTSSYDDSSRAQDRYAAPAGGGGSDRGAGRRGGIGFERGGGSSRRENEMYSDRRRDDDRDRRDWRDRGGRRDSRDRHRSRSRSRSPPPPRRSRYDDDDTGEPRRGDSSRTDRHDDDKRHADDYRRRDRSRSRDDRGSAGASGEANSSRRRGYDERGADGHARSRDARDLDSRDDKRRRLD